MNKIALKAAPTFEEAVTEALQQLLDRQEAQKEAFDEFKDEVLEKLQNMSNPLMYPGEL